MCLDTFRGHTHDRWIGELLCVSSLFGLTDCLFWVATMEWDFEIIRPNCCLLSHRPKCTSYVVVLVFWYAKMTPRLHVYIYVCVYTVYMLLSQQLSILILARASFWKLSSPLVFCLSFPVTGCDIWLLASLIHVKQHLGMPSMRWSKRKKVTT